MIWLYLHFPHLLLDHMRRSHHIHRPMVLITGSGQQVIQACPLAQQQGIQAGMRVKTAIALTPELTVVKTNQERNHNLLAQQARWLYRYVAQIALCPPDGVLLEIHGLKRLYGSFSHLWHTLQQALESRQLTAMMATGMTPKAARLLARHDPGSCIEERQQLEDKVRNLPLSAAEFEEKTLERLSRLGLTRLGDVFQLPPSELARRLSPATLAHIQKIQGQRPDPQSFWQPPHRFHQRVDFVREVEQTQGLLFPVQPILAELEEELQWRQQDTDTLTLSFIHRHQPTSQLQIRTSGPEHRANVFLELTRLRLEQHPLEAPVIALTLRVERFLPRGIVSHADLLGENLNLSEAWHTLSSRLQARLGDQALQRPTLQAEHRPELAWAPIAIRHQMPRTQAQVPSQQPLRPLWLLNAPKPLSQSPEAWLAGPERISSGWWDDDTIQRDYYIVRLQTGQVAWIFRAPGNHWFVHGWFG